MAAPTEIAIGHIAIGKLDGEKVFDVAVSLFTLNEGVADERNPIAILELEERGVCSREVARYERDEQAAKNET